MAKTRTDKAANFKKLAAQRATKVITLVRRISNLSSSNYDYTPDQVTKMFGALRAELDAAEQKFGPRPPKAQAAFAFD